MMDNNMRFLSREDLTNDNSLMRLGIQKGDRPPEITITILGDCEEYLLAENVKKCVKDCITSILEKFNCCLVVSGPDVGVTKVIGDICSTKTLEWNDGFSHSSIGLVPESIRVDGEQFELVREGDTPQYYKLQDDSDTRKIQLNQYLELGISSQDSHISALYNRFFTENIPCVVLVIGGGDWSFNAMKEMFPKDVSGLSKAVVIVLNGSGKLADNLSLIYADSISTPSDGSYSSISAQEIRNFLNGKEDQISIFKLGNEHNIRDDLENDDLEKAMFRAALDSIQRSDTNDTELLLNFFAGNTETVGKHWHSKSLKLMTEWIKHSSSLTRVKELLDKYNFDFKVYVDEELQYLYELDRADCPRITASQIDQKELKNYYSQYGKKKVEWYISELVNWSKRQSDVRFEEFDKHLDRLLSDQAPERRPKIKRKLSESHELRNVHQVIMGFLSQYNLKKQVEQIKLENIDEILSTLTDGNTTQGIYKNSETESDIGRHNDGNITEMGTIGNDTQVDNKIINPLQELLINSVLFLDIKLAKFLWHCDTDNPLSNALLVLILLKGLKEKARLVSKSAPEDFENAQKYFEEQACMLLDTYYKTDRKMTKKILERKSALWANQTLLYMAGHIELKSLFGKQACCMVLEDGWTKSGNNRRCCRNWTPKCKLIAHAIIYILSILAFGFFVVAPNTVAHEPIKYTVLVIVLSLTVDEVRQVTQIGKGWRRNIKKWGSSIWNILDLFTIALFFAGFILTHYSNYASRVVFSLYLFIACMKAMQFLRTMKTFGVYLVMIRKMIKTTGKFLVVFAIAILGCGLFLTALLHPNVTLDWDILLHILFRPSLVLVGETGIENFEFKNDATVFGTSKVSRASEILVLIIMAVFLLFSNILLVNLLIAEFSAIHKETKKRSTEIWMFEQYELLEEFKQKPMFPIPFSVFENVVFLVQEWGGQSYEERSQTEEEKKKEEKKKKEEEKKKISEFERFCYKKLFPKIPDNIAE